MAGSSHVLESPPSSSTPILDRVIPLPTLPKRPKRKWKSELLRALLGGAVTFVLAFVFMPAFRRGLFAMQSIHLHAIFAREISYAIFVCASYFLAMIIHETGHLIAGLCSGYRMNYMRVGPIQINSRFRVSRAPRSGVGLAGLASLFPRRKDGVHARAIVYILGGPLANLISAGCVLLFPRPLSSFAICFAGVSLLLGLRSLMPFVMLGVASDGSRLLMVWRRTHQGERWLAIMQLYSALWDGVLPENLDSEMLEKAIAVIDPLLDTGVGYQLAYWAAFHLHRDEDAARLLETALQYYPYVLLPGKEELLLSAVIFQATRGGRIDLAEQWLKELPQKLQTPGLREQAEAAILEGRKEPEAALAKLGQSEKAISEMPAGFDHDKWFRSVVRWQNELKIQVAASSTAV